MNKIKYQDIRTVLIFLIGLSLVSCSSKKDIKNKVAQMLEKAVVIEDGRMTTWMPDSSVCIGKESRTMQTFVVYVDSTQCSPCFINRLDEWKEMLKLENDKQNPVRFLFIMEPRKNESKTIYDQLNEVGFCHSVLIDDKYIFRKSNPQIPEDALYHTFLLDKYNKVILVGNPLHSEKIKKLFYQRLQQNQHL